MQAVPLTDRAFRRNQALGALILLLCVFDITRTLIQFEAPRGPHSMMTVREKSELQWAELKRMGIFGAHMLVLVPILAASFSFLRRKTKMVREGEEALGVDRTWDIRLLSFYFAIVGSIAGLLSLFVGLSSLEPRVQFVALTTAAICGIAAGWGIKKIAERRKRVALPLSTTAGQI